MTGYSLPHRLGLAFRALSFLLGLIDLLLQALVILLLPILPKFFAYGLGDFDPIHKRAAELMQSLENGRHVLDVDVKIDESPRRRINNACTMQTYSFESPFSSLLPKAAQRCQFYIVRPTVSTNDLEKKKDNLYVIMFPATGEEGTFSRLPMAKELAKMGISTVIMEGAFYGPRRRAEGQSLFLWPRASDFPLYIMTLIWEGGCLTHFILNMDPKAKICTTGFSGGGGVSACAAMLAVIADDGQNASRRLVTVPFVPAPAAECLIDGMVDYCVDYDNLLREGKLPCKTIQEVSQYLMNEFTKEDLYFSFYTDALKRANKTLRWAETTVTLHDRIIKREYPMNMVKHLNSVTDTPFVYALPGGHVTAAILRPIAQKRSILRALKVFEEDESDD